MDPDEELLFKIRQNHADHYSEECEDLIRSEFLQIKRIEARLKEAMVPVLKKYEGVENLNKKEMIEELNQIIRKTMFEFSQEEEPIGSIH